MEFINFLIEDFFLKAGWFTIIVLMFEIFFGGALFLFIKENVFKSKWSNVRSYLFAVLISSICTIILLALRYKSPYRFEITSEDKLLYQIFGVYVFIVTLLASLFGAYKGLAARKSQDDFLKKFKSD